MPGINGDQCVQTEVLEGLATAVNHRRWFVELAIPFLGDDPIEIGSGLGDYALEWAPHFTRFTATEADPSRLVAVRDELKNTSTSVASREKFTTLRAAGFAEVLRGVSFTPDTDAGHSGLR